MRGHLTTTLCAAIALAVGCGGSTPPAEEPKPVEEPPVVEKAPEPKPEPEPEPEPKPEPKPVPEPEFTEGMSVTDAINAVPQGAERLNLDPEEMARPLQDFKLYEPCKPRPNQHWNIRVAVWNGRAVGIDVKTKPKSDKFGECVKERIRTVEWKEKVPSLNTVEYGF